MNGSLLLTVGALLTMAFCRSALPETLAPFSSPQGLTPWTATYLPSVERRTIFQIVEDDGQRVLRVTVDRSAGSLVTAVPPSQRGASSLRWRWRLPAHNPLSDPRTKKGDDFPLRLYVLFDYDVYKLGFLDRTKLTIARRLYGEHLPAAALCYVWDPALTAGTSIWNAFTDRVRMIVVRSGGQDLGRWVGEQRDVRRDFRQAFGEEAPPIKGIAVAGDADNSGGASVGFMGDIWLE